MKQLVFLAVFCLATFSMNAQVQKIRVTNWSSCDVYFALDGNPSSSGCTGGWQSNLLTYIPGQSAWYDAGIVPGGMNCGSCTPTVLSSGDYFTDVNIPDADASLGCTVSATGNIGDPCYTGSNVYIYTVYDSACNPCGTVKAVWTSLGPWTASLDFY